MALFVLNHQFLIQEEEGSFYWQECVELDEGVMIFTGDCHFDSDHSILFLSPWEENEITDVSPIHSVDNVWEQSQYYALISESGTMDIYSVSTGQLVTDEKKVELSSAVGCTMKYQ